MMIAQKYLELDDIFRIATRLINKACLRVVLSLIFNYKPLNLI